MMPTGAREEPNPTLTWHSTAVEDFLDQAPAIEDGRFLVPKILEEEI